MQSVCSLDVDKLMWLDHMCKRVYPSLQQRTVCWINSLAYQTCSSAATTRTSRDQVYNSIPFTAWMEGHLFIYRWQESGNMMLSNKQCCSAADSRAGLASFTAAVNGSAQNGDHDCSSHECVTDTNIKWTPCMFVLCTRKSAKLA